MSDGPDYGARLREWLPALWRERDESGDLGRVLGVFGELLDAFDATVRQRRYDGFPDADPQGQCQTWLLPYFAQLLDVRLVSPDEEGRRAELSDAVAWRQRKGTRVSIEAIAEAVGRIEVETQEGWKRVAITPRVDRPLLPESAYGEAAIPANAGMAARARHPGLPAATVDTRYCSRAVRCDAGNPGADTSNFAGQTLAWRQVNRHGIPCAPDSFQDVSRRTVDVRTPDWHRGHVHPRRVLLYCAPQEGFFAQVHASVNWTALAPRLAALRAAGGGREIVGAVEITVAPGGSWQGAPVPRVTLRGVAPAPVRVAGVVGLADAAVYRFENLWLDNKVQIDAGCVQLAGCAARQLKVTTAETDAPVVDARACLFKKLEAARGWVRLEYATVLDTLVAECLDASDSILLPPLRKDTVDTDVPAAGCLRYSRVFHIPEPAIPTDPPDPSTPFVDNDPLWRSQGKRSLLRCFAGTCTTELPRFWSETFGEPGCGVLHPDAKPVFLGGAEDGGELGACHDFRYVLRQRAVLDKLQEFLPLGMEAVLVPDPSLACPPPKAIEP